MNPRTECAISSQVLFKFVLRSSFLSLVFYMIVPPGMCARDGNYLDVLGSPAFSHTFIAEIYRDVRMESSKTRQGTSPLHMYTIYIYNIYIIMSFCTKVTIPEILKIQCRAFHLCFSRFLSSLHYSHHTLTIAFLFTFSIVVENVCSLQHSGLLWLPHSYVVCGNSGGNER